MSKIILITGASSGFGRLTAEALAKAGHTVYASMRETAGRNAPEVGKITAFAKGNGVDLRTVELDVLSQDSVDAAVGKVIGESGRIDVLIHNAGHMVFGPAEAFTPEQLAQLYDVNVLSTQRVNRAVLPHLRGQKQGLVVWVSSSSSAGGTPPYLAPYFAAKAAMDAIAVVYARELSRWGIETSIIVPGAFTGGTNHFAHSGRPADEARVAEYEAGPYAGFGEQVQKAFAAIVPPDADAPPVAPSLPPPDSLRHRICDSHRWNRGSGADFAANLTNDVDFIGFDGTWFRGKEAVEKSHQALFDTHLKGTRLIGDVVAMRLLAPDVAVMHARGNTIMRGRSLPSPARESLQPLSL